MRGQGGEGLGLIEEQLGGSEKVWLWVRGGVLLRSCRQQHKEGQLGGNSWGSSFKEIQQVLRRRGFLLWFGEGVNLG